ncbi:hypothetical protein B5S31_g4982 [[Candida] boidinii]|uniref:Unnamed protein product n=1 Tax=Candida boidinii TaxID=5477 RepID=A0ACB5TIY5_CANBO|nr:hypothetical protein B5S31_g4982 [[Candida] boidinii]OWB75953.1 hypothetical protein B5S32_g100 [[Candida] boidinii]GME89109.1 unnamed protein product [[Candida] boidinii]
MSDNEKKGVSESEDSLNLTQTQRETYGEGYFHKASYEKTYGVRRIEALTEQYSNPYGRIAVFFSIFLIAYCYGLDGTIRYTYQSYAISSYSQHSLISSVTVVRSVAGAVAQPFYAKLSDIFGRLELLVIAVVLYIVGTIIESQAYDVTRFAAGAILYQFGYSGLIVLLQCISSDFSTLNWRLSASFVAALPFIINTWVSGDITEAVGGEHWSWGIGMWAFILPLSCIPLAVCFIHMHFLARRNGAFDTFKNDADYKTLGWKKFIIETFFWKLDIMGLLGIMLVLGLILTPLTLAGGIAENWRQAHIIVPIVIGGVLIPFVGLWEFKYARYPVIPADLMKDRAVWAAIVIAIFINFCWYMQGDYIYTVMIVAFHESVKSATRITSLYSFVSVITGALLGLVVSRVRKLKGFIIFGISMWFVAFGLMIQYRGGASSHSGFIGAQCLLGFGAGFFTYPTQASIQSVVDHELMATVLSLYLATYYVGSALGGSVSGAVWTNLLPKEIYKQFNNDTLAELAYLSPFTFIIDYPWETPERQILVHAYKYIQRYLIIIGLCLCVPLLAAACLLKNPTLQSRQNLVDEDGNSVEYEEASYNPLKWKFGGKTLKQLFTSSK